MVKITTEIKKVGDMVKASREVIQLNGATLTTWNQLAIADTLESAWSNLASQTLALGYGSGGFKPDAISKITNALNEGKAVKVSGDKFTIE